MDKHITGKLSQIRISWRNLISFQLSFGSISAYVNHYSSPSNDWNVGLTLGWQLFNSRFIE